MAMFAATSFSVGARQRRQSAVETEPSEVPNPIDEVAKVVGKGAEAVLKGLGDSMSYIHRRTTERLAPRDPLQLPPQANPAPVIGTRTPTPTSTDIPAEVLTESSEKKTPSQLYARVGRARRQLRSATRAYNKHEFYGDKVRDLKLTIHRIDKQMRELDLENPPPRGSTFGVHSVKGQDHETLQPWFTALGEWLNACPYLLKNEQTQRVRSSHARPKRNRATPPS